MAVRAWFTIQYEIGVPLLTVVKEYELKSAYSRNSLIRVVNAFHSDAVMAIAAPELIVLHQDQSFGRSAAILVAMICTVQ